jgi:hypothetical protein
VKSAVEDMRALADHRSKALGTVASECSAATGAAEWEGWSDEQEMGIYVGHFVRAACSDRNWLRARNEFRASWQAVQDFEALGESRDSPRDEE